MTLFEMDVEGVLDFLIREETKRLSASSGLAGSPPQLPWSSATVDAFKGAFKTFDFFDGATHCGETKLISEPIATAFHTMILAGPGQSEQGQAAVVAFRDESKALMTLIWNAFSPRRADGTTKVPNQVNNCWSQAWKRIETDYMGSQEHFDGCLLYTSDAADE